MNNFSTQNILISSAIIIIMIYMFYSYHNQNKKDLDLIEELKQKEIEKKPQITSKHVEKFIQKEFGKILDIFSQEVKLSAKKMSEFNQDFLLRSDYLNFRNNLFTKDIEKRHLLVDTKSLNHNRGPDHQHDTSNFIISFKDENVNPVGGLGRMKNVIGFRLIKAVIPSTPYVITNNNNSLNISTVGAVGFQQQRISNGTYTPRILAEILRDEIKRKEGNGAFPPIINFIEVTYVDGSGNFNPSKTNDGFNFKDIQGLPIQRNKYLILVGQQAGFNNYLTIQFNTSYRIYGFRKDLIYNIFAGGPNPNPGNVYGDFFADLDNINGGTDINFLYSEHTPDQTNHFIDVVIDEIPYLACKKNPLGKHIIDRIPTLNELGAFIEYQAPLSEYFSQNYFYPISLDTLSIKLFEDSSNQSYVTDNLDNFFEFEVTMLKNTKKLNNITTKLD